MTLRRSYRRSNIVHLFLSRVQLSCFFPSCFCSRSVLSRLCLSVGLSEPLISHQRFLYFLRYLKNEEWNCMLHEEDLVPPVVMLLDALVETYYNWVGATRWHHQNKGQSLRRSSTQILPQVSNSLRTFLDISWRNVVTSLAIIPRHERGSGTSDVTRQTSHWIISTHYNMNEQDKLDR